MPPAVTNRLGFVMSIVTTTLATLVGLEFLYIMYLETFATASESTSRVFSIPVGELEGKTVSTLFKNQGVYNGLIGLAILWGTFLSGSSREVVGMLLVLVVLVAIYGGMTSSRSIIWKQGGLAMVALVTLALL